MRETIELRVREEAAAKHLPPGTGRSRGYGVRRVVVDTSDPLFDKIGRLQRQYEAKDEYFFAGWDYQRRYTARELRDATLFYVWPKRVFEPAGEECGTQYDDSRACKKCGAGAPQVSDLLLDGRRIP